MEIKNFFQKIFSPHKEVQVPSVVVDLFQEHFSDSLNAEWQKNEESYEVVFYRDDREHIATYQKDGVLLSLKINLLHNLVPEVIELAVKEHGELMNAILIESKGVKSYELIVRDKDLVRFSLLLSESGDMLRKEKL